MNFDDIVEKVFAIWTEEEQLDEDFIDDKRQLIPFETNFEEAEDVSSIVGDDDNADDELQDCENRTGDIEDLDEGIRSRMRHKHACHRSRRMDQPERQS